LIKSEIKKEPETKIFIIGAGFDTRAYRMEGGYWYEFDDPEVIKYKDKYLPESECKNTIKRIPFNFSVDSLEEKLAEFKLKKPVFIIIEGVFIYLDEKATIKLIKALQNQFPQHTLFCDLQNYKFFKKFNTKFQKVLQEFGTSLQITSNSPEQLFLDNGYDLGEKISIIDKTMEYAKLTVSQFLVKILMKTVLKNIKDGYAIYVFKHITPAIN
jgi:O-methyltransferase involved in polyketide biosynthesis